ncbi:hypothetical protein DYB38_006864 [Aphanomyces astaci]|uniref:Uncharacterized protein n=1 Tax=Aphanomyces astaci TaxID=112090 RepID=A0A397C1G1_APHAT|nr:hypothetical protein DYB38_006864 [Aphanomyces astaci]
MATVYVQRNGVPTVILVPATGILRQPQPSSSENDSASDTTECPADTPPANYGQNVQRTRSWLATTATAPNGLLIESGTHIHDPPSQAQPAPRQMSHNAPTRPPLSQMTTGPSAPDYLCKNETSTATRTLNIQYPVRSSTEKGSCPPDHRNRDLSHAEQRL